MSTHKCIDRICAIAVIIALLLTVVFVNGEALGIQPASKVMGYENRLFDTSQVHTIDIVMDDWDSFLETCENEEYAVCAVVIDGESYKNVGIRAKGNTSLSTVSSMDSDRYSFKIEFDQYDSTGSYYGLDKLCLNNLIQDNTLMKDYLVYQMMGQFAVAAPLCSYTYITVNGEDWGLYLAVEGLEESFLQRNYGSDYGDLYKPDSMSMGGGRGNGRDFNMEDFMGSEETASEETANQTAGAQKGFEPSAGAAPEMGGQNPFGGEMPSAPANFDPASMHGGGDMPNGMSSSDVLLQYADDDPDSYPNIFDSAKTDISEADRARLIEALKTLSEGDADAVDIDAVIRYFVVHNFVVNGDSYTGSMVHNYYLYEEDGKLSILPWDYNLAFGGFQASNASDVVNDPIDTPQSVSGDGTHPIIDWIFSSEEYTALYHQYFAEFLDTFDLTAVIEETAALIAPYVEKDPTKFCTVEEFRTGVQTLAEFCALRAESVYGQLDGTIPSTDAGQSADSSMLVDASGITISDMGSMNAGGAMGGMGGGMADRGEMGNFGDRGDRTEQGAGNGAGQTPTEDFSQLQPPDGQTMPEDFSQLQPPDGQTMPGGMQQGGSPQGGGQGMTPPDGAAMPGFQRP